MKITQILAAAGLMAASVCAAEEWNRVAFVGDAQVKSISGFVEVIAPQGRTLKEGETARAGETLRVWRGSDLVLMMQNSKSLVRAKGPVILRLAPESESFERASLPPPEKAGYVVRAVRGGGRYTEDGVHWNNLKTDLTLAEGSRVRPFRDSVIDLYHNPTRTALRLTDHSKAVELTARPPTAASNLVAASAP